MSAPIAAAFDGVSVRYGEVTALREVRFQAPEGAFVSIIGPNGAGKSTLLRVLLGLETPDTGTVAVFGKPPKALPAAELGFIPQIKTLDRGFPAKAIELVVSGLRQSWPWRIRKHERVAAMAALEQVGAAEVADRAVSVLSGGELQRVYLARCLVRRPRLIVLDEPAAGLDLAGEAALYHHLIDYQRQTGATIFMITHDWEGARCHASHVLLMHRGRAQFGAPGEMASEERLLSVFGHAGHIADSHEGCDHA